MLLILPAFTRRPSLVTGCHSFSASFAPPRRGPLRPRPRPLSPPRSPRLPNPPRPAPAAGAGASAMLLFSLVFSERFCSWGFVLGENRGQESNWQLLSFVAGADIKAERWKPKSGEAHKFEAWSVPLATCVRQDLRMPRLTHYFLRPAIHLCQPCMHLTGDYY